LPAAKHSSPLSPARIIFLSAVTILVALVVWVAVRAVGPSRDDAAQPTVVVPTVPVGTALPAPPPPQPSTRPTPSPSRSRSASSSPSVSHSPSPSPSASRRSSSPSPSVSRHSPSPPAAAASFTVTVTVTASWDQGYVATVQIVNKGTKAATWSVSVSHSGLAGLRLDGTWNAQGRQSGSTFVFAGGPLDPGATASFGYQAGKHGGGKAQPAGCSVGDGTCHVS
jgi:hypothetical protein